MAIRTRTTDGYQQVELTSELLHGQSGQTQQVISTVPWTKHLPFFLSILLADIFLFNSAFSFAIYGEQFGGGFHYEQSREQPFQQWNLHALIMLVALVYLNGQAIMVYKANYLVKHKSINMLHHFLLHLLTAAGIVGGIYMTYQAQESAQSQRSKGVVHFYSVHSWSGIVTVALFTIQFLFGFFSFFVTLCCRKLSARMRARALPIHQTLAMIVFSASMTTIISGLTQLARFQMNGLEGKADYREFSWSTILINLSGASAILAMPLIFFITFVFKRRQAHDLPVLFKIILLVAQFIEVVLIVVMAEFVFQVVTPHVNKVINGELFANGTTLTHLFNNATQSIGSLLGKASQHIATLSGAANTTADAIDKANDTLNTIVLGSTSLNATTAR